MSNIRICIVDDHPVLMFGIRALLVGEGGFDVIGLGASAAEALALCQEKHPDVIIMDLNMPGNVNEAISEIVSAKGSNMKVLAFTAVTGVDYAIAALEMGASGYVLKGSSIDELKDAIHVVHAGGTFISPGFASKLISGIHSASLRRAARNDCRFSVREEQVLRLLLKGQTNGEIADALELSEKTIKHYMSAIMQKLNARNRIEAVLAAQELGFSGSKVTRTELT